LGIDGGNKMLVKLNNPVRAIKGDSIELCLSTSFQLKGKFIVFVIPVLGHIMGAIFAAPLSNSFTMDHSDGIVVFTILGFLISVYLSKASIK